jgi:hypothetical protein
VGENRLRWAVEMVKVHHSGLRSVGLGWRDTGAERLSKVWRSLIKAPSYDGESLQYQCVGEMGWDLTYDCTGIVDSWSSAKAEDSKHYVMTCLNAFFDSIQIWDA